jgi:hypothetical protein
MWGGLVEAAKPGGKHIRDYWSRSTFLGKVFDLFRLEVEGLPVNISPAPGERAKPSKHLRTDRNVAA